MWRFLAEKYLGVEHGFELLLHQSSFGGAGLRMVAKKARKPFEAVAVAIPRGLELVGVFACAVRKTWLVV